MIAPSHSMLALDTATTTIVVAAAAPDLDEPIVEAFEGRYRHSQELLPAIVRVLDRASLRASDLTCVVVGTGPGAFTGLRVGIATAKTLAHELAIPIIGVPTSDALLAGIAGSTELWLPSGPRDIVVARSGEPPSVVPGGTPGTAAEGVVAVDLDGRAPEAALERGRAAVAALAVQLLRLGAARLEQRSFDDPERLVPRYASLPRGAPTDQPDGDVAWSRDPR